MMRNLVLEEGDLVQIESVSLPVATFSKFKPQSPDFLEITNQKAVLENALRNFACLTAGDLIAIKYNSKIYELCVLETKPGNAVSIIECDMNVEFDSPVGYQEPKRYRKVSEKNGEDDEEPQVHYDTQSFVAFTGEGTRLDGKKKKIDQQEQTQPARVKISVLFKFIQRKKLFFLFQQQILARGIPDYDHPYGLIRFDRSAKPTCDKSKKDSANGDDDDSKLFQGEGFSLRKGRK